MKGTTSRNAKPVVFMASLLLLLGGCTQDATQAPGEGPVVAAVAKELGGHRFLKVHAEQNAQGYTIESGNLTDPLKGKIDGSLVVVTDKDGAITAIIDRPGRRGTLHVDKAGVRRFLEEPPYDYLQPDSVEGPAEPASVPAANKPDSTGEIDVLVLYSAKALEVLNGDPVAFALAQLETSNLGLRNSQVAGVHLRLAGIRVTETDYAVDGPGLKATRDLLEPLRPEYRHDINVGYFAQVRSAGLAWIPGSTNINAIQYPMAFRHEVAHNVGGGHCYPDAGDNYKHGFKAGEGLTTNLCGNGFPYYSNPDIRVDGKPIGNARTANMARLWREQAGRLSGYSPAFQGERAFMVSPRDMTAFIVEPDALGKVGVVTLSAEQGPVRLENLSSGFSILTVKLQSAGGREYPVNFRGSRFIYGCEEMPINSYADCQPDRQEVTSIYIVSYFAVDNPELPTGWYNGVLRLKALDQSRPGWEREVLVSLAVRK